MSYHRDSNSKLRAPQQLATPVLFTTSPILECSHHREPLAECTSSINSTPTDQPAEIYTDRRPHLDIQHTGMRYQGHSKTSHHRTNIFLKTRVFFLVYLFHLITNRTLQNPQKRINRNSVRKKSHLVSSLFGLMKQEVDHVARCEPLVSIPSVLVNVSGWCRRIIARVRRVSVCCCNVRTPAKKERRKIPRKLRPCQLL